MHDTVKAYLNKIFNSFDGKTISISEMSKDWPESWKKIEYKNYVRFPKINLEIDESLDFSFTDSLKKRNSFALNQSSRINFKTLSSILYYSFGEKKTFEVDNKKRMYPSAGGRYPLEVYVFVNEDIDGLGRGVYHFSVSENYLEKLWIHERGQVYFGVKSKNEAKVFIVISSIYERSSRKYAEIALKFSYIEAGSAGQNVCLISTYFGISNSWVNHDDKVFSEELDLDVDEEFITGTIVLDFEKEYE